MPKGNSLVPIGEIILDQQERACADITSPEEKLDSLLPSIQSYIRGGSGLVSLPEQPVEVLIVFSILISAIHAIRPLFPGREPLIAAGFGLIHGLAFATTLQNLGVGAWQGVAAYWDSISA